MFSLVDQLSYSNSVPEKLEKFTSKSTKNTIQKTMSLERTEAEKLENCSNERDQTKDTKKKDEKDEYRGYFTLTYDKTKNIWKQMEREYTEDDMTEVGSITDSGIAESEHSSKENEQQMNHNASDAIATEEKTDNIELGNTGATSNQEAEKSEQVETGAESDTSAEVDAKKKRSLQEENQTDIMIARSDVNNGIDGGTNKDEDTSTDKECVASENIGEKSRWASLWLNAKIKAAIANSFTIWRELDESAAELAKARGKKAHNTAVATIKLTPFKETTELIEAMPEEKIAKAQHQLSAMKRSYKMYQLQAIWLFMLLVGIFGVTIYRCSMIYREPQPWNLDHIFIYGYCAASNMIEQFL